MKRILLCLIALLWLAHSAAWAQERTISGRITSEEDGSPLPGVNVVVKGTTIGTVTDATGNYTLSVPANATTIVYSFIGLLSKEVEIGNKTSLDVPMAQDVKQLTEVVVSAGGIERQVKEQGYNTTNLNNQRLVQGKSPNLATGLTGKVAGLQINAVGSGVNPSVRVVLRGMRSLTGNNQALLVMDNVIVPNDVLSNINPEDIESISVLNGANAAALYGSDASNGAIILTTKKGKKGVNTLKVAHTTTLEQVSFYPKLQKQFGSGYYAGVPFFESFENQQYGPAFDGSIVKIGKPTESGAIQEIVYSPNNDKYDFWETGVQNQTDFSISSGTDKSTFYVSGQRYDASGTTPEDRYNRVAVRVNGTHDLGNKLKLNFNSSYTANRYDITTSTGAVYDQLLNTPAQIPVLDYKDWRNNEFANPNGYYNEYYRNPYFTIDNNREDRRNNYLVGNVELKYAPLSWLDFTYRLGVTNRNETRKLTTGKFTFSNYTKSISNTTAKSDIPGSVTDETTTSNQLLSDFQVQVFKEVNDFSFRFIAGNQIRNNRSKVMAIGATGLVNPGLYNIANRIGEPVASEGNYLARQVGVYGDLTVGYKDFLFVHATGRNDWTSLLAKENRSFFYPAVDVAFTATEAIPALGDLEVLNNLKIRGGWSRVGQVNLGASSTNVTYGAYRLLPTFSPTAGFPYGSLPGFSAGNQIVSASLKPEVTTGYEFGFDAALLDERIDVKFTYYTTNTTDQTVSTGVSNATGFSSFLTNTGEVKNSGVEGVLFVTPYKTDTWTVTVGGNYTFNKGEVVSISNDLERIAISSGGNAQVYAVKENLFPVLLGTDYVRDDQGRIVVNRQTGLPSIDPAIKMLGNTEPRHRLGLEGQVRYKNFRLTALFEYRGDYYRYHNGGSTYDFSGSSARSASFNHDRFVIPNSSYMNDAGEYVANTNITVPNGSSNFWASGINMEVASNFISRADYWRFREASLAYDLPSSVLGKTKFIKAATISIQGRNLALWLPKSNQWTDPDYNFTDTNAVGITSLDQTPPTRYYGATVSLTF